MSRPRPRRAPWAEPALAPLGWRTFLFFAFVYLYAFPYFDQLRSANELPRVLMTQEIVERGSFKIDRRVGEMRSTFDTSRGPDGSLYPNKAPGPSFLAVPVYAVCKLLGFTSLTASTWAARVFAVTIPALLFLPFFYRLAARFSPSEPARRLALISYALASSALPYSVLFISHTLAAVAAGSAFVTAVRLARGETGRPKLAAMLVGVFAAAAVMMDYQTVVASVMVGLYVLVRGRGRLRNLVFMVVGAAPLAAGLAAYHTVCFGGPLKTPLSTAADPVTQKGFLGMVGPSQESFHAILTDPSNGLLILMPWSLFALVGLVAVLARRESRARAGVEAVTCLLIIVTYTVALASLAPSFARSGWCVGPRYMTAAFPFLAWLAAPGYAVAHRWIATRILAQGLVIASAVIFLVAASTFPHWPEGFRNPLYELAFRLVYNGYATHSLGTLIGLKGIWAMLPQYLVAFGLVVWILAGKVRRTRIATGAAVALALVILLGHRAFPLTGPYSDRAFNYITKIWEPKRQ